MSKLTIFMLVLIVMISFWSCDQQKRYHTGGPYYYRSFVSYKLPLEPIGEIKESELSKYRAYNIVYFDKNGKILSFEKFLDGKSEFKHRYKYDINGKIVSFEGTNAEGKIETRYFDANGKLIEK